MAKTGEKLFMKGNLEKIAQLPVNGGSTAFPAANPSWGQKRAI